MSAAQRLLGSFGSRLSLGAGSLEAPTDTLELVAGQLGSPRLHVEVGFGVLELERAQVRCTEPLLELAVLGRELRVAGGRGRLAPQRPQRPSELCEHVGEPHQVVVYSLDLSQ